MFRLGVKLSEIIKLPSLKNSEVIAGEKGLEQMVTSLSFLEISDMSFFNDEIQIENEYYGGEIVITSFYAVKDSIEKQCEAIRRLHKLGHIGIILYYVGVVLPELSQEVIDLADTLDFTIVKMPPYNTQYRYNEAVFDIMSILLTDKSSENLVNDVLERVSDLPEEKRGLEITLKILSDYLKTSIVLENMNQEVLFKVPWPRNAEISRTLLSDESLSVPTSSKIETKTLYTKKSGNIRLHLIKEGQQITPLESTQAGEVVEIALNMWGDQYLEVSNSALMQAIMNFEPKRIAHLSDSLSIQTKTIDTMWLIQLNEMSQKERASLKEQVDQYVSIYYEVVLIRLREQELLLLLGAPKTTEREGTIAKSLLTNGLISEDHLESFVFSTNVSELSDFGELYAAVEEMDYLIEKAFKYRRFFTSVEILQIKNILATYKQETSDTENFQMLAPILQEKNHFETLSVFLLDAEMDFDRAAHYLNVHKNTVKYRMNKISDLIGYDLTNVTTSYQGYQECLYYYMSHFEN